MVHIINNNTTLHFVGGFTGTNGTIGTQQNATSQFSGTTTLDGNGDQIWLAGDTVIEAGATFIGGGQLANTSFGSKLLTVEDGVVVGVRILNNARMQVGNSAGQITVDDFVQGVTGTLFLEIGGTVAGTQYDQIIATDHVIFNGTLDLSLIDGFVLVLGDEFVGITGNIRLNEFTQFQGAQVTADLTLVPVYDHISVIGLTLVTTGAGDVTMDGVVDVADLGMLAAKWSDTNSLSFADALQATGLAGVIPEPGAMAWLTLGAVGVMSRRRLTHGLSSHG